MKRFIIGIILLANLCFAQAQLKLSVQQNEKWVWYAPETPEIQIVVKDSLLKAFASDISLVITTDTKQPVFSVTQNVNVAQGDSAVLTYKPAINTPGFYRCEVFANGKNIVDFPYEQNWGTEHHDFFNIAYEPENIVSLPDYQADFKAFWDKARAELAEVEPNYEMTELKEKSSKFKKFYLVKMQSLGGDTIQLYVTIPKKPKTANKKCPVHIYYMGYNSGVWDIDTGDNEWITVLLSVRGQALNKPTNKYGDWIQYGLDNPEHYYYRGAYMDCVRAIDFVCTLPQADKDRIYAEGGSQGGAFTMAAASLDSRLKAVACYITFMSDFPDYFKIVNWPADPIFAKQHELGMSDEQMYRTMSYFDIKNLARWITCPVYLGVGLQDPTCPPHTNFSGYNLVSSPKKYIIYPHYGHHVDYSHWNDAVIDWYNEWK